jgi:L-fuculose-phosphate aldolase
MYSNNIIKQANELNCSQISDLINIREAMGIKTGGIPPCESNHVKGETKRTSSKEEVIASIVRKVTEEVLKNYL